VLPVLFCNCRWFDALSPLLVRVFQAPAADAAAAKTAQLQLLPQQQQQLRACAYHAVNKLLEGSCCGSELQLLVMPLCLQEVLQELMPDACLTGV
jgi:hypothetical protein